MEGSNNSSNHVYNLFVKLLDGKTLTLKFPSQNLRVDSIKHRIFELTRIPPQRQRLITGIRSLEDGDSLASHGDRVFPSIHLLLRLVGGKGGFGSLLRGAATKAGQKKTNNFDACRDMSGRRLRHVNAEKKLEEWKEGEAERRLEKMAEEFLKKQAKKGKKGVGDGEAQKYVAKYREVSEKCTAEVAESVKEALMAAGGGKRKGLETIMDKTQSKKMKIWMGKRKLGQGDSDYSDEDSSDDEEGSENSTVLNNGNQSDSSKEAEGSSGSITCQKQDPNPSRVLLSENGSEEEREIVLEGKVESCDSPCNNSLAEPVIGDGNVPDYMPTTCLETEVCSTIAKEAEVESNCIQGCDSDVGVSHVAMTPTASTDIETESSSDDKTDIPEENPLDLDIINSASELEGLGMDRLKSELQARGLKCGGTLQERAARLFLLKSTPVDKLPKKLLAKK